ncbi:ISAs1 family transposase [Rubinisphaera italica]|uniref:ISAs1 family transposase n=1 Tax=Rubinisphaera italica TaxID=2527969 RepID=UPI0011B409B9
MAIIVSARTIKGKESWESRFFVSSHPVRAKFLTNAIRRHWSIENSQHYVLDVTFGDDHRHQQDCSGASNLAAVRRVCCVRKQLSSEEQSVSE